jgi:broad specificity phosphatase PhoE
MGIDFSPLASFGKTDFYLLRHGKSEGNHRDIVQGRLDFPLSDEGRAQAELTGRWFADRGIRFTRCTPLLRGAETAAVVCREAGLPPPETLPDLLELDTGVFTGLPLEEARERNPGGWPRFLRKSWDGVDGAESSDLLRRRAEAAWTGLVAGAVRAAASEAAQRTATAAGEAGALPVGGKPSDAGRPAGPEPKKPFGVLAVAHAGILQWLIKVVCGGDSWFPLFPMGHCGIYHLSVDGTVTRWEKLNFQVPGVTGKR